MPSPLRELWVSGEREFKALEGRHQRARIADVFEFLVHRGIVCRRYRGLLGIWRRYRTWETRMRVLRERYKKFQCTDVSSTYDDLIPARYPFP